MIAPIRAWSRRGVLGALAATAAMPARPQDNFPNQPVTITVGYQPGGSNDIMARNLQAGLAQELGQSVVVLNKPGASGIVATTYVAKSRPDGYTLLLTWDTHVINAIVQKDLPFDITKDFAPISLVGRFPLVMVVGKSVPVHNAKELVALAKAQPGKLNFASVGAASSIRLYAENFIRVAGITAVHLPYQGAGPAVLALLSGDASFSFLSYGAVKGYLEQGTLTALAVTGSRRLPELPDVPTIAEAGYPGSQGYSWMGVFGPAKTPPTVVARLNRALSVVLKEPSVRERVMTAGVEPISSSPEELASYINGEFVRWSTFVRDSKLNLDQ